MPTHRHTLGKQGEAAALQHLRQKGYQILACNWRFSRAEIDIICKDKDTIVFVEVKTRSDNAYINPLDTVTAHKMRLMTDAATQYLYQAQHEGEYRFDIITALYKGDKFYIEHFEDAFWL